MQVYPNSFPTDYWQMQVAVLVTQKPAGRDAGASADALVSCSNAFRNAQHCSGDTPLITQLPTYRHLYKQLCHLYLTAFILIPSFQSFIWPVEYLKNEILQRVQFSYVISLLVYIPLLPGHLGVSNFHFYMHWYIFNSPKQCA